MKRRILAVSACLVLAAAGCAGPQFYPYHGPQRPPVALRSVTFEREIPNNEWKSLVDAASDAAGNAYVLDGSTHRVWVFDPLGKPLLGIGESGFWKKTFPRPSGVAVDGEGRVLVSDAKNDSVQVFDRTGAFSFGFGEKGAAPGAFYSPMGIDTDAQRNAYVVDQGNNRLQKFDSRGTLLMQIASGPKPVEKINISRVGGPVRFVSPPQFKRLRDVAVGPDGTVYLLDEGTCLAHAYSPEGVYLYSFGGRGLRSGRFDKPSGIAAGAMGVVCIADEKRNTVQFFDPAGSFLLSVGGKGKGRGQFREPQGVGASPAGRVFVADRGNRRVQVFSYGVPRAAAPVALLEKPVRIAVFDFKNNNPAAQQGGYGEAASEMFITAFARRPNFEVVERKQLRKVLDEIYLGQSGVVEAETAKKVGKVLGIDVALAGGVAAFAGGIEMDVRLLDVESGKVILADSMKAPDESRLRDFINQEVVKLENGYIIRFCPPFPPAGLTVEGAVRECRLGWAANKEPDFREYRVFRAAAPEGPYLLVGKTREPEWFDKGLSDGTSYYYCVSAVDAGGLESKRSASASIATRGKPVVGELPVTGEAGVKRTSFSWKEADKDVTGYVIYRSASAEGPYSKVGESRAPDFSEKGFGDGEKYYYKVAKKYRSGIESEPSSPFACSTKPLPSTPGGFAARGGLARKVVLEWANPPETDIKEFRIYRSRSEDGEYRKVASVKPGWIFGPGYTDEKLDDDTAYFYKIEAVDKDGLSSAQSSPVKAVTKRAPSSPAGLSAAGGKARSVPLAWARNPEGDIARYLVFSADRMEGPFRQIAETAETSFVHAGLKDIAAYYYKIKATDKDGLASGFSPVASATTKPRPAPPKAPAAQSGLVKSVRLTWDANPEKDIVRYTVSRAGGRTGSFKTAGETASPGYTDRGLEDGKHYRYTVTATDADGLVSDPSDKTEATTKPRPSAPRGLRARAEGGKIVLAWEANPETDIAGYEVLRSSTWDLLGGEQNFGLGTALRLEDSAATPGKTYRYRVVAVDREGLKSDPSARVTAKIPAPR